jgi:NADP-dependent aldehyde dehydrogenase
VALDAATETHPSLARVQLPLGPVAVFGASNFPFAFSVLGNDTASALAAGCPVVAKAHPAHPLTSQRLGELAEAALADAGAPVGTFSVVSGFETGIALVKAPDIRAVAFTGSQAAGLSLWRAANEREVVIPVFAEMGTINPVVVTRAATARLGEVAAGFVGSFTLGFGQFCTKPGLLLAPAGSGAAEAVAAALGELAPTPHMLTSGIAAGVSTGVEQFVAAGAVVVQQQPAPEAGFGASAAVLTTPIEGLHPGSRLLEECFGPVVLVAEYAEDADAVKAVANLQGALAGAVMSGGGDDPQLPGLLAALTPRVGRVIVDSWPTAVAWEWAQNHGGPWPATTDPRTTSVGAAALERFVRPVTYQGVPDALLPPAAQAGNPWSLPQRLDGRLVVPAA